METTLATTHFTPWSALIGGGLIGLSAVVLMWFNGRIAGISGILASSLTSGRAGIWRLCFIAGLLLGAAGVIYLVPGQPAFEARNDFPLAALMVAGVLVGFGSRLGSGCTSGHGICGIARLSPRSIVAVLVFMASAGLTAYVSRHLIGIGV